MTCTSLWKLPRTTDTHFQKSQIFWLIGQPGRILLSSLSQYSGRTITSAETNDNSKESSDTQLSEAESGRVW